MSAALRRHVPDEVAEDAPRSVLGGRRWTLVAALVVVGLIVTGGLYALFGGKSEPAAFSGPAVAVAPAPDAPGDGSCNFPDAAVDPGPTTIAPTDVGWTLAGAMATPSAPSAGPLVTVDGISSCFARTPQGALLAAANWATGMNNPGVNRLAMFQARIAHTGGFDQMLTQFEALEAAPAGDGAAAEVAQIAAFRMLFFDPSHAEMELVFKGTYGPGQGYLASTVYVLVWENDDWKIAPVLDGDAPITRTVTELRPPYVAFAGA
jgi:hypothetical protein